MNHLHLISSLLIVLAASLSVAAAPRLRQFTTADGLSDNHVMGMAEDPEGYVWISTESGLNRYNGTSFDSFRSGIPGTLSADELNRIVADPVNNCLWIATQRNGLDRLDFDTFKFTHYGEGSGPGDLNNNGVTDIAVDKDGRQVWVSMWSGGLDCLDVKSGKITHYNKKTVAAWPSDNLWTVALSPDGLVFIGHVNEGFTVFDPNSLKVRHHQAVPGDPAALPNNTVKAILPDANETVWVGTYGGLALYDVTAARFVTARHDPSDPRSLSSNSIHHLGRDAKNNIWVATEQGGVSVLSNPASFLSSGGKGVFVNYSPNSRDSLPLSSQMIQATLHDRYGNVWIGSYGEGIDLLGHMPEAVGHISTNADSGLSANSVTSVCAAGDTLYVGTDLKGLDVMVEGKRIANINAGNSPLQSDAVLALMRSRDRQVWIGTGSGVAVIGSDGKVHDVAVPGSADVRAFAELPGGVIAVGNSRGVALVNPNGAVTTCYDSVQGVKNQWVRALYASPSGDLWVGSYINGISIFSPDMKLRRHIDTRTGIPSDIINGFASAGNGKVWAATGSGLVLLNAKGDIEKKISAADGLPHHSIKSVVTDTSGTVWVTTSAGVSRIGKDGKITNLGKGYGLSGHDFNVGAATCSDADILYFGSNQGLTTVSPRRLSMPVTLPVPVVTDVRVYSEDSDKVEQTYHIAAGGEMLTLPYDENTLLVNFGIQDATIAPLVEWSYRIEEVSDRWYPASPASGIMLRNMAPGKYTITLRASVSSSGESSETSFTFHIRPPWWLSTWAIILYVLAALALIFIIVRFSHRRMMLRYALEAERRARSDEHELTAERMRFFTNITHELRTPLTLILGPLDDLKSDTTLSAPVQRKISTIHKSASRLLELINTILEFRKTETQNCDLKVTNADISLMVEDIGSRYRELNTNPNVEIRVDVAPGDYHLWYDPEVVGIIIDNLMSNACKYTVTGAVTLHLDHTSEGGVPFTEISVSDTGLGIESEALPHIFDRYYRARGSSSRLGTGIGLALIYNLAKIHEGEIFVESEPERGSTFRVRLRTDNIYKGAKRRDAERVAEPVENVLAADSEPEGRSTVLVIDDNIDIVNYIAQVLSDSFVVLTATDGSSGLALAQEKIPDIIITDLMMPKMSGVEMISKLKESAATSFIPIVVITAKVAEEARVEAYEAGADAFITKPFTSKLLRARLVNIITKRRQAAEKALQSAVMSAEQPAGAPQGPSAPEVPAKTEGENALVSALTDSDREFLEKLTAYIVANISNENLDVDTIAREMFMSHSTLYRRVKAVAGVSIARFIRKCRITRAAELLKRGDNTVSEVSMMVGMSHLGNFRNAFREEFGVNPSEFRG